MNVLIVDDDRFVVAALEKGIHWTDLDFENVYTAYGMEDARNTITSEHIDLLLSDIDMPHGSGIDLLRWLRDHHNETPCIFLTNYADFEYAQQAVDLHCFHYFLKPVDYERLTSVIKDAISTLQDSHTKDSHQYLAFWHHFSMNGDTSGCPYLKDTLLLTMTIKFYPWFLSSDNTLKSRLSDDYFAAVTSTFKAVIPNASEEGAVISEDVPGSDRVFIAVPLKEPEISSELSIAIEEFLHSLINQLHCPANMYVGTPVSVDSLYPVISDMREMMRNDLASSGHVLTLKNYKGPASDFPDADPDIINACLDARRFDDLTDYCNSYLEKLSSTHRLSARSIESFQIDIVQALYSHLAGNGLLANRLYTGEPYHTLSKKSRESVWYIEAYLRFVFAIAEQNLKDSSAPKDVAQIVKDFVDRHYTEDINRDSLGCVLYFDPDYASRLFKKQYGISFTNYVIQKRITEAKKLLTDTTMPISTIASKVGYDNYSYFTRLFKKEVGVTPINYRANGGVTAQTLPLSPS